MLCSWTAPCRRLNALRVFCSAPAPQWTGAEREKLLASFPGARATRVRQHVNPLAASFQQPMVVAEGWQEQVFEQPELPLHLDIGCAGGLWTAKLALATPGLNVLGLEIRQSLPDAAEQWAREHCVPNLHFLAGNANLHAAQLFDPARGNANLHSVSINFPDPWFKKKHRKRRVVQPALLATLAAAMAPGARVLVQTDVLDVCEDMVHNLELSPDFEAVLGADALKESAGEVLPRFSSNGDGGEDFIVPPAFWAQWSKEGGSPRSCWPFALNPTEREMSVLKRGLGVFRAVYTRR